MAKTVMVVDDDRDVRNNVALALEYEGYTTVKAFDGQDAIEKLLAMKPEELPGCIILDLMMPRMDGYAFIEKVKTYGDRFKEVQIIIASAKGSLNPADRIPDTLVSIRKPMDLDELYSAVERHCGKP